MVKKAEGKELIKAAELAVLMWDEHTFSGLVQEFEEASGKGTQFFLKYEGDEPVGLDRKSTRLNSSHWS